MTETPNTEIEGTGGPYELSAGLDARFLACPQLVYLGYGPEPSLYAVLCSYYNAHGKTPEQARKYAVRYSQEWARQVANV